MIGLDTNVLVRHLIQDEPRQSRLASTFIKNRCSREEPGFINRVVLCELVWVLESSYGYERSQIAVTLEKILQTHQFQVEDPQAAWTALRLYAERNADFADSYIGETNIAAGCAKTLTFGKRAAKLPLFELVE